MPRPTTRRSHVRAGALAVVIALAVTGCSGGDDEPQDPGTSPSTSPTSSPPTSVEGLPEPSAAPATGPELEVAGFTARIPEGWVTTQDTAFVDAANNEGGRGVQLIVAPSERLSLAQARRRGLETNEPRGKVEDLPTTTLVGRTAYHYRDYGTNIVSQEVGTWIEGYYVALRFTFIGPGIEDRQMQQEIIDSVTATVELPPELAR